MEWNIPQFKLSLSTPTKHSKLTIKIWNKIKTDTKKKYGNNCAFCGGKYKSTICYIFNYPKACMVCDLCYAIKNLTINNHYKFEILRSNLSQVEIVRKYVDYYLKHSKSPKIINIDNNATKVPLSLIEYLKSPFLTDLKVFPNEYFCPNYLDDNSVMNMIIEEDSDTIISESEELVSDLSNQESLDLYNMLQQNDPCENIKEGELTLNEKKILRKIFNSNKEKTLNEIKKYINIDFDVQETDMNYQIFIHKQCNLIK